MEVLSLSLHVVFINETLATEKFTGLNKVLLVLGWRTGAHREDC
jgi:hypothetical protein